MDITIIGSGNIASHLGRAFHALGHPIIQVYSRNKANAEALASTLDAQASDNIATINPSAADLYLIAVRDQAIASIVDQLPPLPNGIVVHCSGATDMVLLSRFPQHGVIYPAQSVHKDTDTPLRLVPFGIEGSSSTTTDTLFQLMRQVSDKSFLCDSEQRLALHVAAVFANNFSNALFQIAYDILQSHQLSFDLLKPIILETANKVQQHIPQAVQTGPAKRGDQQTMEKHLQFLRKNPDWLKIYQQLSLEIDRTGP